MHTFPAKSVKNVKTSHYQLLLPGINYESETEITVAQM